MTSSESDREQEHILVIGSGGREHALAWKIASSPRVGTCYVCPGNAGTHSDPRLKHLDADTNNADEVARICAEHGITLVVVGPEAPLVAGLADGLRARGVAVVGPGRDGARLEASKSFCKEVMVAAGVPTARYARCTTEEEVAAFARSFDGDALVVKADGLAGGKGVVVCDSIESARTEAIKMLRERTYGDASSVVVLEERLYGVETSFIVLTDGTRWIALPTSQDHKRLSDNDEGPNTGGMGAYSPAPFVDQAIADEIERTVIEPTLSELRRREIDYRGFLYAGVMLTNDGPRVLEFNVRLGDPETQALVLAIGDDIVPWLIAAAGGRVPEDARWSQTHASAVVVLAAEGYPTRPVVGAQIQGIREAAAVQGAQVFHAGTRVADGGVVVAGGRVLGVAGVGSDPEDAVRCAYTAAGAISWPGMQMRRDIGAKMTGLS